MIINFVSYEEGLYAKPLFNEHSVADCFVLQVLNTKMLLRTTLLLSHPTTEGALFVQSHVHKVVRLFPVFHKHAVSTTTAIPSQDETTEIHRAWKAEVAISVTLSQHLLSVTKNIYELVQLAFS